METNAQPRIIQVINNNQMTARHAMPHKEAVADGTSSFSAARQVYMNFQYPTSQSDKKWFGGSNRDASSVIDRRRNSVIGNTSLNEAGKSLSFTNHNDVNLRTHHIRYVRAGGATVPRKSQVHGMV
jgi:hypothetical protein